MILRRVAALLGATALLAGCSGSGEDGKAALWVTRDHGTKVLLVREVPAGLTVLQALDREADVETRFGGRFVQAIDGLEGSLSAQRDWFYFVNGYEADRGAAEYRLRPGDVAWWDYRSWRGLGEARVVVGAFPEPFLHGYGGQARPAAVRYAVPGMQPAAEAIAARIGASSVAPRATPVPAGANLLELAAGRGRFTAETTAAGAPVRFVVSPDVARRLAAHPGAARFRYRGLP